MMSITKSAILRILKRGKTNCKNRIRENVQHNFCKKSKLANKLYRDECCCYRPCDRKQDSCKLQAYLVIFRDDKTNINPDRKSTNLRESAVKN